MRSYCYYDMISIQRNTFTLLVSQHELVSVRAQRRHSDEMERRRRRKRRGVCKLGRKGERERGRERECVERERESAQAETWRRCSLAAAS